MNCTLYSEFLSTNHVFSKSHVGIDNKDGGGPWSSVRKMTPTMSGEPPWIFPFLTRKGNNVAESPTRAVKHRPWFLRFTRQYMSCWGAEPLVTTGFTFITGETFYYSSRWVGTPGDTVETKVVLHSSLTHWTAFSLTVPKRSLVKRVSYFGPRIPFLPSRSFSPEFLKRKNKILLFTFTLFL